MNRIARVSIVVFAALVAVVLSLSLAPASGLRAQGALPGPEGRTSPRGDGAVDRQPPAVFPGAEAVSASAYLAVPGVALHPEDSADVEWAVPGTYYGCIYANSGSGYDWFNAPFTLPPGSTVTSARVYYYDASSPSSATFEIVALDLYGDLVAGWYAVSSGSGGFGYVDIPISNLVIDYLHYTYLLWWHPGGVLGDDMMVCSFQLFYNPPGGLNYMPSVLKDY